MRMKTQSWRHSHWKYLLYRENFKHIYLYIYIYSIKKKYIFYFIKKKYPLETRSDEKNIWVKKRNWPESCILSDVYWIPRLCSGKESPRQCRRLKKRGFDRWVGKIPWSRKLHPLQYSCLDNSMDRGAWRAIVHEVPKSWTRLRD